MSHTGEPSSAALTTADEGDIEMRIGSISGSLQRLVSDVSYLVAGSNVTIASGSNGQVTISSIGGGGGGGGYEQAFNSGDLVAGVLSVTHGLPDDYVHVSVYDDTDHQIIPNEVIITGVGTLDIDLSSYVVPASPDWHVFITSANASLGGGTPASPDKSVQYNNASSFGGSANFTYDGKLSLTGSLIQSNAAADTVGFMGDIAASSPASIGTDVFFYVSGTVGSKGGSVPGVSAFGGDVVISGSMFADCSRLEVTGTVEVTNGISGSLTQLVDGTSYLIAGTGISITSQSNGSILISNTFQQADDFFDSTVADSIFTSGSAAFVGVDEFGVVTSPADKGTDVFFYVSGTIGSKDGLSPGVSLFGGDVSISGSLFTEGDRFEMSGTLLVTEGISGSLTQLVDGTSYLIQGSNTTITSQSNGSIVISSVPSTPTDSVQYNSAGVFGGSSNFTYDGKLSITGSFSQFNTPGDTVGFMGDDSSTTPMIIGTDVFFYVSGSKSSKDGPTPTVALFGGDVVISGTLHGGSPLKVGTRLDVTGSITTTEHFYGEVQLLTASGTDISNVTHMTLMTSTTGEYTTNLPDGLHVGQIKYILAGDVTNAMSSPTITVTATTPRPVGGLQWISITFVSGDAMTLVWTAEGWAILSLYNAVVNYPS